MKIKRKALEEHVRKVVREAAKEGRMQKVYRKSFADMIDKTEEGDNENTPPFTKKPAGPGRSGPIIEQIDEILYEGAFAAAAQKVKNGLAAIAKEYKDSASATGKILRKLFAGEKLSKNEYKLLAVSFDNIALPAMLSGYLLGGVGGIGLVMLLSYVTRAFALPEVLDPQNYVNDPRYMGLPEKTDEKPTE